MPLYTCVASWKGATYVNQARRSNFQGFGDWATELPKNVASPSQTEEITRHMYGGFEAIPNRTHAWRKSFIVDGADFIVIVVQTED